MYERVGQPWRPGNGLISILNIRLCVRLSVDGPGYAKLAEHEDDSVIKCVANCAVVCTTTHYQHIHNRFNEQRQ